jgi:hypothetical protein
MTVAAGSGPSHTLAQPQSLHPNQQQQQQQKQLYEKKKEKEKGDGQPEHAQPLQPGSMHARKQEGSGPMVVAADPELVSPSCGGGGGNQMDTGA